MHLRQSTRLRLLRTLKERILRWIGAIDEAAIPKYCNEDEPQGAQKAPFRAGPFCFDLVKAAFGCKAKMLAPAEAEALTGHAVGGVCPFAVNAGAEVYLDESLRRFSTVFPACGSSNSAIELTCAQLEQFASNFCGWADVCKLPSQSAEQL